MSKLTKEEQLQKIDGVLDKLNKKDFNVYFMVIDTKGNTSGSIEYLYQLAYKLMKMGYKTTMAYVDITEKDKYVGPFDWLDKKYEEIPYVNVKDTNVMFGPEDFIFIPEILSDVIFETKDKLNSKKILVVNDYKRMADFFPVMTDFASCGIHDCITTTERQKGMILKMFPGLNVSVVSPAIENKFRPYDGPKKLMINVVSRNPSDRNRITKEFYWKYPIYRWVSFRDLRSLNQDVMSDAFRDVDFTIWVDDNTEFGYSALEALKSGNIVLAKIPNNLSDWMETGDDGELTNACIWFRSIDEVPEMIASLIRSWTLDKIPTEIKDRYKLVENLYTNESQEATIKDNVVDGVFARRISDFNELKTIINSNNE